MKDTCTPSTSKDFRARYQGTIGCLVKNEKEREFVWIDKVDDYAVSFKNKAGHPFQAMNGKGVEFEFTQVPHGWFNTSMGPVHISRIPARQWQRGIADANTKVLDDTLHRIKLDLQLVEEALTCTYTYKGTLPYALSRWFCISKDNKLYFRDIPIGTVEGDSLLVDKSCNVLQELGDLVRREKLPFTIKVENE
jgi:hypothetical protein